MVTVTKQAQLDDIARPVAALIERLGFTWELHPNHPTPDSQHHIQVRDEKHRAPRQQVSQYAAAMARGDKFAPVVVTSDGYVIDGNTRVEAAHRNRRPDIQAFVLNAPWDNAPESVQRRLRVLGAGFNARNGRGIDRNEITHAVVAIGKDETYDASRIATLLGVTDGIVHGILAEQRVRERARKHNIEVNGSIPASQLQRLGQASNTLNDAPFLDLLRLTQEAGLSKAEVVDLIKQVRAAGSDDAALALLSEQREARRDQIADFRASGKSRPPTAAQLRQRLGFVLTHQEDPGVLVEHSPTLAPVHRETIQRTVAVLTEVLNRQDAASSA